MEAAPSADADELVGVASSCDPRSSGRRLGRSRVGQTATDVLVLDASMRQALVATRALGRAGFRVGTAESPELAVNSGRVPTFKSRWSAAQTILPGGVSAPDTYAARVLELALEQGASVVIPASDGSIAALQPWRSKFDGEGVTIALAADEALLVANDKQLTLLAAVGLGIATPTTVAIEEREEVVTALRGICYPAVVKPTRSWVRIGDRARRVIPKLVVDETEAIDYVDYLKVHGSTAIVQQWLPGRREAVNLMFSDGQVQAAIAQLALRTAPPLGGVNVVRETIPMPEDLRIAAVELVESLQLEGYSEVEFRRDAAGRPYLMEINARLTGGIELATRAGINFPEMVWQWASGREVVAQHGYRTGVRMRFLAGDCEWLWQNIKYPNRPDGVPPFRAAATFAREFLRRQGYDYVDFGDLRPALAAARRSVDGTYRRSRERIRGASSRR
jgi:predicted ATP-grasp superfamily ATP-dependent carboligase